MSTANSTKPTTRKNSLDLARKAEANMGRPEQDNTGCGLRRAADKPKKQGHSLD